jgi:hypothetical protein
MRTENVDLTTQLKLQMGTTEYDRVVSDLAAASRTPETVEFERRLFQNS